MWLRLGKHHKQHHKLLLKLLLKSHLKPLGRHNLRHNQLHNPRQHKSRLSKHCKHLFQENLLTRNQR